MDQASGGGIGKAAKELMAEMQRAQADMQQKSNKGSEASGPNQAFQQAMEGTKSVQPAANVQQTHSATRVLMQAKDIAASPSTRVGEAATTQRSRMADMLEKLVGGQDKMSSIMKLALSGRQFNSQELLAMQAGVYRFSQELDLTGKVVEKATSGIKQTMNTQV
jgi:hypothetical protein